jgi:uncharacterized protein (TIGR00369 family)
MTIDELNQICKNSFVEHLGIRFTSFDGTTITGIIDITPFHLQPQGVVHGGVYIAFAETIAGAGSALLVEKEGKAALGNTIQSQHISAMKQGRITAKGTLVHKGTFKHIWDVQITDDSGKLISLSRVSNSIKELNADAAPGKD